MGWGGYEWKLSVLLDEHAGEREREDARLWDQLQHALADVCRNECYAQLHPIYDDPPSCHQRGSTGVRCTLRPNHEGPHIYRDSSGEYTETSR